MLKFCTRFILLNNVYKRMFRIFYILFRTWVICQNQKRPGFYTLTETRFINNSRSKQNKKNPEYHFVGIGKTETCAKFQQKTLNAVVVGARQRFQFFREITCFLANKRALSKIKYYTLHTRDHFVLLSKSNKSLAREI